MISAKSAARPHPAPVARRGQAGWTPAHDRALQRGLEAIGLEADPAQRDALGAYARLLLKWNRTYNLLGTVDPDAILESHLLDSLAVVPVLDRWLPADAAPLVDVGSGGGLPGIPIAIMRPGRTVVLVEPIGKKAAFLRQAVAESRLVQATVREARLEALSRSDIATPAENTPVVSAHFICRAFTSLAGFANLCAPRAGPGSLVMAMKAARVEDEIMELRATVPQMDVLAVEPLSIPGHDVQRNLVVMRTTPRYATEPANTMSGA